MKILKIKTKKKFIEKQIDSFMILIENRNSVKVGVYKEEFMEFCRLVTAQGHLSKLDEEYKKKFFEINKVIKDMLQIRGFSG